MKRHVPLLILAAILWGLIPNFASATPRIEPTATITVSPEAPAYGDFITLSVTTNVTPTDVTMTCSHAFGESYSTSPTSSTTTYSDDVGLYAPNWPSGGASCLAEVELFTTHGHHYKTTVIGSLAFTVAP